MEKEENVYKEKKSKINKYKSIFDRTTMCI
jgi:hypothetical protein